MHILSRQTARSKETEMQRIQLENTSPAWEDKRESKVPGKGHVACREKSLPPVAQAFQCLEKTCKLLKSKHFCLRRGLRSFLSFSTRAYCCCPAHAWRSPSTRRSLWSQCVPRGRGIHRQSSDHEVKASAGSARNSCQLPERVTSNSPAEINGSAHRCTLIPCAPRCCMLFSVGLWSQNHRITESQNQRMVGVGRDHCGSSSPTLLPKQGHLQ